MGYLPMFVQRGFGKVIRQRHNSFAGGRAMDVLERGFNYAERFLIKLFRRGESHRWCDERFDAKRNQNTFC